MGWVPAVCFRALHPNIDGNRVKSVLLYMFAWPTTKICDVKSLDVKVAKGVSPGKGDLTYLHNILII